MRICIVTNGVEAHRVLMQFPDVDAVIQKADSDLITTFMFREGCVYGKTLKNVQSNFGWHIGFSPARHVFAPVLGSSDTLKTKIRKLIPETEIIEFVEFHRLACA